MAEVRALRDKIERALRKLERLEGVLCEYERGGIEIYESPRKLRKLYQEMSIAEAKYVALVEKLSRLQPLTPIIESAHY